MKLLSRAEEVVLITVLKLEDNAYGVAIRDQIKTDTGSEWSFASIYTPLDKLTKKNYLTKHAGEPARERGGRRKYIYEITEEGRQALHEMKLLNDRLWTGVKTPLDSRSS